MASQDVRHRPEIDTSAPFESVKEATTRFGGMAAFCASRSKQCNQEQAAELEHHLITKERETLDILKELETAKSTIEQLMLKVLNPDDNNNSVARTGTDDTAGLDVEASAPSAIFQELKRAKSNLTRTTNDLAQIRASLQIYNEKIEQQRILLDNTHQRLSSAKTAIPEEDCQTTQKQEGFKDHTQLQASHDSMNITRELQKLSSVTQQFKQVGEAAKSRVLRAISEIERTRTRIRNAEIRLVAAKRMKEAAKASEAVALAEIRALTKRENKGAVTQRRLEEVVTLTHQEYLSLIAKVEEADKACNCRAVDVMVEADEANLSKAEILKMVAEATEEVKTSKKALEEVLQRVEAATRGKLEVEHALRQWRSNRSHKRRCLHNSTTRFKNSHPSTSPRLVDTTDLNRFNGEPKPVLKPSLSIGQILSRKLVLSEEYRNGSEADKQQKVSLGQMLGKEKGEVPGKRKKFDLGGITVLVAKQSKKKKKISASPKCCST